MSPSPPHTMAANDDEYCWLSLDNKTGKSMYELDSSLICPICCDYFKIPVSLSSCQHSFCSECIRSHFKQQIKKNQKQECPNCRAPASDTNSIANNSIMPNVQVGRIVKAFLQAKPDLVQQLIPSSTTASSTTTTTRSSARSGTARPTAVVGATATRIQLQRRAPTRYYGLSKKQLQELCAKDKLPTNGSDEELKQRHADFCLMINAECDAEFPRGEDALRRELIERENTRKRVASSDRVAISSTASHVEKLKLARKMVGENDAMAAVKSGDPNFDSVLSNNFQKLIAEAKHRQKRKVDDTSNDAQQTSDEEPSIKNGTHGDSRLGPIGVSDAASDNKSILAIANESSSSSSSSSSKKGLASSLTKPHAAPESLTLNPEYMNHQQTLIRRQQAQLGELSRNHRAQMGALRKQIQKDNVIAPPDIVAVSNHDRLQALQEQHAKEKNEQTQLFREQMQKLQNSFQEGTAGAATSTSTSAAKASSQQCSITTPKGYPTKNLKNDSSKENVENNATSPAGSSSSEAFFLPNHFGSETPYSPPSSSVAKKPKVNSTSYNAFDTNQDSSSNDTFPNFCSRVNRSKNKDSQMLLSAERATSIIGPWECPLCTYLNTERNWHKALCEVCEKGQRATCATK